MRKATRLAAWVGVVVLLAAFAGCSVLEKDDAETRVTMVFDGLMTTGNTIQLQTSISQWSEGKNVLADHKVLASAWDQQKAWLAQKGLKQPIASYEILSVELTEDPRPGAYVRVNVEGQELRLWVEKGEPIAWAD